MRNSKDYTENNSELSEEVTISVANALENYTGQMYDIKGEIYMRKEIIPIKRADDKVVEFLIKVGILHVTDEGLKVAEPKSRGTSHA